MKKNKTPRIKKKKMHFCQIFRVTGDRIIEPIRPVRVSGLQFGVGTIIGSGVSFSGVDLTQYIGHDLQVEERADVLIITGIY